MRVTQTHPRLEAPPRLSQNHEYYVQVNNEAFTEWFGHGDLQTLQELNIHHHDPITNQIFVKNLAYIVDERKLVEVFSASGRVVFAQIIRNERGHSRGMGVVEFMHPVEALQAMIMMKQAKLYNRHLIVCSDRVGPSPVTQTGFTEGLVDVSGGLGENGTKVKVDFIEGNPFIHSPDCASILDTPITYKEAEDYNTGRKILGGIVHLQMTDISARWARASPAQAFVDNMISKKNEIASSKRLRNLRLEVKTHSN